MGTITYTLGRNYDPGNKDIPVKDRIGFDYSDTARAYVFSFTNPSHQPFAYISELGVPSNGTILVTSDAMELRSNTAGLGLDFSDNSAAVDLSGGDYGDVLRGGSGDDTLNGGSGNDLLEGGLGQNTIDGGAGVNTVSYEHYQGRGAPLGVRVDLEAGAARESFPIQFADSIQDTLIDMQNIRGSAFSDVLRGDAKRNVIEGGGGADTIIGVGAGGVGPFADVVSYLNAAAGVTVDLSNAANNLGDAAGDIITNIDIIFGSTFADSLTGDADANLLYGQGGADSLFGMGGDDKLFARGNPTMIDGGDGSDQLQLIGGGRFTFTDANFTGVESVVVNGGQTADFSGVSANGTSITSRSLIKRAATIVGGSGDDRIKAGAGGDTITGGGGNDVLSIATKLPNGDPAPNSVETFVYGASGFGRDVVYGIDVKNDHIKFTSGPDEFGDLLIRESGTGTSALATSITIRGQSAADAIVLRGVSEADVNMNADSFFQFAPPK